MAFGIISQKEDCFWCSMLNLVITCLFAVFICDHGTPSFKIHTNIFV